MCHLVSIREPTQTTTFPSAAEMIDSLFLINHSGDIFLEKHWKSVVSRSVCDYFFEAKEKAVDPENVAPVLQTPHHYLISIYRDKIFFLSAIQTEVPPLFVIEFLHRVGDTFLVVLISYPNVFFVISVCQILSASSQALGISFLLAALSCKYIIYIKDITKKSFIRHSLRH